MAADNDNSTSHNSNEDGDYETYFWNEVRETLFEKDLTDASKDEKIVHWKRNLFIMPSGAAGKKYIEEITAALLKLWIQDSPLKKIAIKEMHVMPVLLIQKPSKKSDSKDNLVSLERCLKI